MKSKLYLLSLIFVLTLSIVQAQETPEISDLEITQLHEEEQLPHKYNLLLLYLCSSNLTTTISWSIDCGYFWVDENVGAEHSGYDSSVEWRYNSDGECVNAKVNISVIDEEGYGQKLSESIFNPEDRTIVDITPTVSNETNTEITDNDEDDYNSTIDCNDSNSNIHPDAEEVCDGIDNNCNGEIDEGDVCEISDNNQTGTNITEANGADYDTNQSVGDNASINKSEEGGIKCIIKKIKGIVDIKGKSGEWVQARVGDTVVNGHNIQTGFKSEVLLECYLDPSEKSILTKPHTIEVSPLTWINLNEYVDEKTGNIKKRLDLKFGKVKLYLKRSPHISDFRTSCPNDMLGGVRGTIFTVSYDEEKGVGAIEVEEGIVEVTNLITNEVVEISAGNLRTQKVEMQGGVIEISSYVKKTPLLLGLALIIVVAIVMIILRKKLKK